ncbi:MAG: L-threonylcarbamoyladenylate synthase [Candidatus Saccharibacteria bacterium]|nr:L-threonylcarbamoyladenylate synthase [Candidatus Saccharibacteria bacterium]
MKTVTRGEAARILMNLGRVGVMPTDTVYGLVCRAQDKQAVSRLYSQKQRENKPGTVIAANVAQLVELGFKYRYVNAGEQFWPGPVSVVLPLGHDLKYLHLGKHSLAVRITADGELKALLEQTGPLLTSSANHPGKPESETIDEAKAYFGDSVDFYVDGGDLSGRKPSTVIRIIDDAVEVLRQGAVKIDETTGRIIKNDIR